MRGLCFLVSVVYVVAVSGPSSSTTTPGYVPPDRLWLDVDNTLYSESILSGIGRGIEAQIVRGVHEFYERFESDDTDKVAASASPQERADALHQQYGSTIEGLRQTRWKNLLPNELSAKMRNFYERVYQDVDVTALLDTDRSRHSHGGASSTGYSHNAVAQQHTLLRDALRYSPVPLGLASNSPKRHISKVIQALGLTRIPWHAVCTPDCADAPSLGANIPFRSDTSCKEGFPTKLSPNFFPNVRGIREVLLDDSPTILRSVEALQKNLQGILVSEKSSLLQGLGQAIGWTDPAFEFSQVEYLRAKNVVDMESIHEGTWQRLGMELRAQRKEEFNNAKGTLSTGSPLCVVDVGAGLLSMLRLILHGHGARLPSLVHLLRENQHPGVSSLEYYAYEPNRELGYAATVELERLGFGLQQTLQWEDSSSPTPQSCQEFIMVKPANTTDDQPKVTVYLRFWDYQREMHRPQPTPHVIVGCCFADLMDPYELSRSLLRRFLAPPSLSHFDHTLVYFPITFCGVTQFLPPQPMERIANIPSDTTAFALYAKALREIHGHSLDPYSLEQALGDYGATCLARGQSDWQIDPSRDEYLWETMLYFFGTVTSSVLEKAAWNALGWLERTRGLRPSIQVSNTDLLFRFPHVGSWQVKSEQSSDTSRNQTHTFQEIQFTAPFKVKAISRKLVALGPNQVRIRAIHSLISSGTELKIFKGLFEDAALDLNIEGMTEERMSYPLSYGYCSVGRVVECGMDISNPGDILGKLVFTFSSHASEVVTDRDAIQIVPDGIGALDAIFMPSVETALSIVHDAHIRMGENVAVFGQGLIGLLVTALFSKQGFDTSGRLRALTVFDMLPDRLAMSALMGATQALLPSEVKTAGPFDVAIEVSGNGRALQAAIDNVKEGGRIVIASWYGSTAVDLNLGIEFHRSHKILKTSQVSKIPAELGSTWTKERRFALAWELVREYRPSRLVTKRTRLEDAQEAYEALENGSEIAIAFDYDLA